jgi:hypothetical protein
MSLFFQNQMPLSVFSRTKDQNALRQAARSKPLSVESLDAAVAVLVRSGFAYDNMERTLKGLGLTPEQVAAALYTAYPDDPSAPPQPQVKATKKSKVKSDEE